MKNTDEVTFWIFGDIKVPKLAVLGTIFGLGLIIGFMLGRPRRKKDLHVESSGYEAAPATNSTQLTDEDRDYIN